MQTPAFVLVHSPLVGPLSWQPTAKSLRQKGHLVLVPSLGTSLDGGPPYYRQLARRVTSAVTEAGLGSPVVVAGHSGAGALLPAISGEADVHAAIFVDAILPHPGLSWFDTAPAALRQHLLDLARGAVVPRWNEWFPADALSALLPEAGLRERFVAELPELPVRYFEERAPEVPSWPPARCGYVQLSEPYQEFAAKAGRKGWPVIRENADHLAMLTQPDQMADILDQLGGLFADRIADQRDQPDLQFQQVEQTLRRRYG